ncbi:hypothetical protein [Caproiciproducens sp. LBM24188]
MKDIIVQICVPILTALLAFISATYKSKIELNKQIQLNNTEIEKIKEQCNNEIEKIKIQMDKQSELYEKNAQTDVVKSFFDKMLDNPENAMDVLNGMTQVSNMINHPNNNNK